MSEIIVILLIISLFVLIFVGVPIGYALLLVGFVGIIANTGFDVSRSLLWNSIYSQTNVYTYSTIPMFILMALFLNESEILEDVFGAMDSWTRAVVPGGLAIGTTAANGVFAALSGSSTAAAAAVSKIAKPELDKFDYDERLSMGTIAASGTFAMMFPPSLALIIYGVLTDTSIGSLFIAGIIPGLMTLFAYVIAILVWTNISPSIAGVETESHDKATWSERINYTTKILPGGLLIVLVLGGIYTGAITPTESGAVGAAGALLLGVIVYELGPQGIRSALSETANITAYVFLLIIAATFFGRWIALEGVVEMLFNALTALPIGDFGILLIIFAVYIVLGMFLNQLPILILTLPITFPLAVETLGYSPIWFGIVIIKIVEIGLITPPIGINAYIASNAVDVDADITFRGAGRFILADLCVLALLIAFPELVTFLPERM